MGSSLHRFMTQALQRDARFCPLCLTSRHTVPCCPRFLGHVRECMHKGEFGLELTPVQWTQFTAALVTIFARTYSERKEVQDAAALRRELV